MPGNILCLEQFSSLGGGQLALTDLLPALRERGWKVRVALPGEGPLAEKIRELHFPMDILPSGSYSNGRKTLFDAARYALELPRLSRAIGGLLARHSIDLLYANAPRLLPAASLAARRASVPLLFHCHNRITQPAAALVAGHALRFSRARVIACSRFAATPLRPYVAPERLSILYNGVAPLAASHNSPPRRIGVIGRVEPEKGQLDFVRAARLLIRQFPDCTFSVVGAPSFSNNKYFDDVVRASQGLPMHFTGWRNDIANVFSGLDVLVVPSTPVEAAARVIVEAFAARVPVVAFAAGGIPEIVEDGVTGFLADPGTPEALAVRIATALTMDLRPVIDRAYKSWQTNYTLDAYRQRVTDLLCGAGWLPAADWQSAS
ncbi:MAG TPA: glycosyltransferase family 4 protein [Bryobacteraceae bacterium]|nr:glycosyltransferase family 4 protein [Bryobacteraceae bacterium]